MSRLSLSIVTLLVVGGCHEDSSSASTFTPPAVTNLGVAVLQSDDIAGDGDLWLVAVNEIVSGSSDLNGDGDAFDSVVFVHDLAAGTATNTFLALAPKIGFFEPLQVDGDLAVFITEESLNGNTDLNADGDSNDWVVHVHDRVTGLTRNLMLAANDFGSPVVSDDIVVFAVSEFGQGDVNGDGDAFDHVLHVYDARSGNVRNTNQALGIFGQLFVQDGYYGYYKSESGDLNGDGDSNDVFLQIHEASSGAEFPVSLASDYESPLHADGTWTILISEYDQAETDLNGDGDVEDTVYHTFDPRTGFVRNLGVVHRPQFGGTPALGLASRPSSGRETVALPAAESSWGSDPGIDHNGDGDLFDIVPMLYDPSMDTLIEPGIAGSPYIVFVGELMAFLGSEPDQGADLNGDGDELDQVTFVTDPRTGITTNLGLDALALRGSEFLLLVPRAESLSGKDWNGDGDQADDVVHVWDRRTRRTTNTGIAASNEFGATEREVLLFVRESLESRDLNSDQDLEDLVFVLFDLPGGKTASLGLAGGAPSYQMFGRLTPSGRMLFLASESSQEQDLNGDGDQDDMVLHRAE